MAVSVQFEIGHTAKLRAKKTPEGFTHDWDLYVRGSNKADISAYVEKVVFNLHESFQRPKRVIKEPPYILHESGYASFMLNIDIYFRNRDEPKRVQYTYDLDLQQHGPPHHRSEEKKFLFENPSEDFRQRLLKGGGVPVVPAGLTGTRSGNPNNLLLSTFTESSITSMAKHKSNNGNADSSSSIKKIKHDSKLNTFANLFGTHDSGAKSSSSIPTKTTAETLKTAGTSKIYSPNSTIAVNSVNSVREKSSKEGKEKSSTGSGSGEKSKEKFERKEKHKSVNSSPSKEIRSDKKSMSGQNIELGKSEKRSEDKPKKDKSRDKDRDRSRSEHSLNTTSSSSSIKSSSNSKSGSGGSTTTTSVMSATHQLSANPSGGITTGNTSVRTATLPALNRIEEKVNIISKSEKPDKHEKETKDKHSSSSSSGKKSKKEKKDKDRDKDKDREKEKHSSSETKSKDDRTHGSISIINNSPNIPNTLSSSAQPKSASSKKNEKESKQESLKSKTSNLGQKSVEKQMTTPNDTSNNMISSTTATEKKIAPVGNIGGNISSNNSISVAKSHKHKKKDKNKEKDKDRSAGGDKEKDKFREKQSREKLEEKRETEKSTENTTTKAISPELKKVATTPTNFLTTVPQPNNSVNTTANTAPQNSSSSKKSQSKERKSKDSKNTKEAKKRPEAASAFVSSEPRNKINKTTTPLSTAGSNIELSDADSRQSTHDILKSNSVAPGVAVISTEMNLQHSDSSCSSFPDIPIKNIEKTLAPTSVSNPEKGNNCSSATSSKHREKEKNATKQTDKSAKIDKEEKKRRRNTVTATTETITFVEPPLKQAKKEQNKITATTREITKSPLHRSNNGSGNSVAGTGSNASNTRINTKSRIDTKMQDNEVSSFSVTSPSASALTFVSNSTNNHSNIVINSSAQLRTTPLPSSPALNSETIWPNLSELQELHRKIMTLQDSDDLQQVVEMIAASGCYEITQRTFDFDLCKLDRTTVERLQEFFATSVS